MPARRAVAAPNSANHPTPPAGRPRGAGPDAGQKSAQRSQGFVFSDEVRELLADVARRVGISQAAVIELALRRLAHDAARHEAQHGHAAPFPGAASARGAISAGAFQAVRLSPHAQAVLRTLADARPRYGESRVAVLELALRRFARLAEREGLAAPPES